MEVDPTVRRKTHADQRRIRPARPIQDISEYIVFLEELEAIFGRAVKSPSIAPGNRFPL